MTVYAAWVRCRFRNLCPVCFAQLTKPALSYLGEAALGMLLLAPVVHALKDVFWLVDDQ